MLPTSAHDQPIFLYSNTSNCKMMFEIYPAFFREINVLMFCGHSIDDRNFIRFTIWPIQRINDDFQKCIQNFYCDVVNT